MPITAINVPELRSIIQFNRLSLEIANITQRLETGKRINSSKDDPAGTIAQADMLKDIRGLQSAQKNVSAANEMLNSAESGLASVAKIIIGDITDPSNNGLIGLIYDDNVPAAMKQQQVDDLLNLIDATIYSTNYGGKRLLDGTMATPQTLQLGKDVNSASQYRVAIPNMNTPHLGGTSGTLAALKDPAFDWTSDTDKALAQKIVNEAIQQITAERSYIGSVQKIVLDNTADTLGVSLTNVTQSEGLLSNADTAVETSKLNRAEILAQAAMTSLLYNRNFNQYVLSSLL